MNTTPIILAAALLSLGLLVLLPGQGDLTPPPGVPAPTMKTLDQIEARTPIDAAHTPGDLTAEFIISQPGSYYLTGNISVAKDAGIRISSSNVTVDLNGFTLSRSGVPGGVAIQFGSFLAHISVRNGFIGGEIDFASGIRPIAESNTPRYVHVSGVQISNCIEYGIELFGDAPSSTVEDCIVRAVGRDGIRAAEVRNCWALGCGDTAILAVGNVYASEAQARRGQGISAGGVVVDSRGFSSESIGILADGNVSNSIGHTLATSTTAFGISTDGNVTNSTGTASGGTGIRALNIENSSGKSSAGDGIYATGNVSNSHGNTTGTSSEADGIEAIGNIANSTGTASGGVGIRALNIENSSGTSTGNDGIRATGNVSNSRGTTTGTSSAVDGIEATQTVANSTGISAGGDGIKARTISYSRGESTAPAATMGADGLQCVIAVGCTSIGGEGITNKYLMP